MAAPVKYMRTQQPTTTALSNTTPSTYTIGCTFDGNLPPNYTLVIIPFDQNVTFGNLMGLSQGYLQTAPTAPYTLGIFKNGTSVGTMAVGAGINVATFTGGSISFVVGDVLTVVTPMSIDPTAANIGFTLSGIKG